MPKGPDRSATQRAKADAKMAMKRREMGKDRNAASLPSVAPDLRAAVAGVHPDSAARNRRQRARSASRPELPSKGKPIVKGGK